VWLVSEAGPRELLRLSAQDTRKGINGVAFSPDGTRVMTGDLGITAARVWDVGVTGDAEVANLPTVAFTYGAAVFTADGRHLVATGAGGSVTQWDAHTLKRLRTLGAPAGASPSPTQGGATVLPPVNSGADVFSIDVSRDGRMVATARFDGSVRVWDAETGEDAFTVDPGPTVPGMNWMDVTWNPDGELLAVAANDGRTGHVTIFDRSGRTVTVLQEEFGTAIGSVAFGPDGDQIITTRVPTVPYPGPDDGQLVVWDWTEGTVERIIATPALIAAASPTGHLVAATNRLSTNLSGETVDVWDTATGRRVATLAGNTGGTMALAFSADGSRVATANADGTVRIWDPHSGQQLLALRGHNAMATSVSFSPDGSRLASVGADGTLRVWALDLDDLIEIAEHELTRTLTDQECQQYLHVPRCP
jgi:WD40 repeat protein